MSVRALPCASTTSSGRRHLQHHNSHSSIFSNSICTIVHNHAYSTASSSFIYTDTVCYREVIYGLKRGLQPSLAVFTLR